MFNVHAYKFTHNWLDVQITGRPKSDPKQWDTEILLEAPDDDDSDEQE